MKSCSFHSKRNCFVYFNSEQNPKITENDVLEITHKGSNLGYFSAQILSNSKSNDERIFLNGVHANKLNVKENDQVTIKNIHRNPKSAQSITLKPLSNDDWQILELNLDIVENNLLDQIKVIYKNQIFPIWVETDCYIFVKTIDFEPCISEFVTINSLTRVIVEPYFETKSSSNEGRIGSSSPKEWTSTFHVEFFSSEEYYPENSCHEGSKCTSLTKAVLSSSTSSQQERYMISIEALEPPIQTRARSESKSSPMKKFFNSISNSYPSSLLEEKPSDIKVWALLTGSYTDENKSKLKISNFLRRQLKLFEINPKVLVKATLLTDDLEQKLLSSNTKKSIKLRVNNQVTNKPEDIRESFVRFIDQECECLCPILLSHGMILELDLKGEKINCQVVLADSSSNPIGINSSQFLSDLVSIEIETIENGHEINSLPTLESLASKKFNLSIFNSKWFDSNLKEIESFLEKNLFTKRPLNYFRRSLMLYGLKGSGKSTICRYLCNEMSKKSVVYHFIDCQSFMNKTADTIYDQLKQVYQDCVWYENQPCLVVLENIDLLIENKSHSVDPSSMLYHAQIVEAIKDLMSFIWSNKTSRVVTIITTSAPFIELPSIFHCLDEHGFFSHFATVRSHSIKEETREIIETILKKRGFKFESKLLEFMAEHSEGFVFKDIEKLIELVIFNHWSNTSSTTSEITLSESEHLLSSYVCVNMLETKFYKSKHELDWSQIGGLDDVKQKLTETLIWPIKYKEIYSKLSMKHSGGCLLYGPSGCGKTLLASALANESKFNFMSVKGPELLSKFIGASEQNVRELFNRAQKAKPCIVFFDEFDSLAPKRGHDSTGVTDRVVNQLLTLLDGIEQLDGVYVLAATSRPDLIDQALLRPGRLDLYLFIDYPKKDELKRIIGLYLGRSRFDSDNIDLDELVDLCEGLSGADIKAIVGDALVKAFHRITKGNDDFLLTSSCEANRHKQTEELINQVKIEKNDLLTSIASLKQSVNFNERKKLKLMYENWKKEKSFSVKGSSSSDKKPRITLA